MVNYKEILRLKHEGYSQRQIESSAHCSRHTVRDVLAAAETHNLTYPLDESVTNEQMIRYNIFRKLKKDRAKV